MSVRHSEVEETDRQPPKDGSLREAESRGG